MYLNNFLRKLFLIGNETALKIHIRLSKSNFKIKQTSYMLYILKVFS